MKAKKLGTVLTLALVAVVLMSTVQPMSAQALGAAEGEQPLFLPFVGAVDNSLSSAGRVKVKVESDSPMYIEYTGDAHVERLYKGEYAPSNPCASPKLAELYPDINLTFSVKKDWPVGGTLEGDGLKVEVTKNSNYSIDWKTFEVAENKAVGAVIIKGGTDALAYVYPNGASGDEGLLAPLNTKNGKLYEISNVTFCLIDADGPGPEPL